MTKQTYTLKGTNDESHVCEQCGKTNLKKVMVLDINDGEGNETGNVIAMGTTCGAKALGLRNSYRTVEQVKEAVTKREKDKEIYAKVFKSAKKMATQFSDEIGIYKTKFGYATVRGKAYDANPSRYGFVKEWVTA